MRLILISMTMLMVILMFNCIVINVCFDLLDKHSIEIILNKLGITYNLSIFEKLAVKGLIAEIRPNFGANVAYKYRSHIDNRIIIVVTLRPVPIASDNNSWDTYYLTIKVEPKVEQLKPYTQHILYYRGKVLVQINTATKDVAKVINMLRGYVWEVNYEFTDKALSIGIHLLKKKNNYKFFITIDMDVNNTNVESALLWVNIALSTNEASINFKDDAKIKELVTKLGILNDVLEVLELLGVRSTIKH